MPPGSDRSGHRCEPEGCEADALRLSRGTHARWLWQRPRSVRGVDGHALRLSDRCTGRLSDTLAHAYPNRAPRASRLDGIPCHAVEPGDRGSWGPRGGGPFSLADRDVGESIGVRE